jgi:hypothetical protein
MFSIEYIALAVFGLFTGKSVINKIKRKVESGVKKKFNVIVLSASSITYITGFFN